MTTQIPTQTVGSDQRTRRMELMDLEDDEKFYLNQLMEVLLSVSNVSAVFRNPVVECTDVFGPADGSRFYTLGKPWMAVYDPEHSPSLFRSSGYAHINTDELLNRHTLSRITYLLEDGTGQAGSENAIPAA